MRYEQITTMAESVCVTMMKQSLTEFRRSVFLTCAFAYIVHRLVLSSYAHVLHLFFIIIVIIIIIIIIIMIKDIYTAQVREGHKCTMSAEMAVWLRNCLCLYSYLHN